MKEVKGKKTRKVKKEYEKRDVSPSGWLVG